MILLLGGTAETPRIANGLAENGIQVLISNLTDTALDWNLCDGVQTRHGKLDSGQLAELVRSEGIVGLIDAGHPYAQELHSNALKVCKQTAIAYYRYERPSIDYSDYKVEFAASHEEAARLAFSLGGNVLLTTGSRNLEPYVRLARQTTDLLYCRILPRTDSWNACRRYGVEDRHVIAEQGPFTTEQNLELIRRFDIHVLVTKDSGVAGGAIEKLEAAQRAGCRVVVVARPTLNQDAGKKFRDIGSLIDCAIKDFAEPQSK